MGGAVADHGEAAEGGHVALREAARQRVGRADVSVLGHEVDLAHPQRALARLQPLAAVVQVELQRRDAERPGDDCAGASRRT
jgi:hypothetical protein